MDGVCTESDHCSVPQHATDKLCVGFRLDLNNPEIYRDLSKPIGALNADRLNMLRQRYHDMPTGDGLPEVNATSCRNCNSLLFVFRH